jgi:recombination protein RecA
MKDNKATLALSQASNAINKEYGAGALFRLGDASHADVQSLSSGNLALDIALGGAGLPKGRVIEIYGPESSGKTTVCLEIIAQAQRAGGNAAFIDVEHSLDPRYAKGVGVNTDALLVSQPDCGEDALNITEALIRSHAIDVIVIDSVAALVPRKELEGSMGDASVGAQARLMSQAMRRLTGIISSSQCICIFTNQIREKIGVMFGSPETQPGGRALKFFSSQRLDIRRIGQIKAPNGSVIGNRTRVKVVKNKVAPPFTECEFDIVFGTGICQVGTLLDLALDKKLLEKKGSWISYNGALLGQGRENTKEAIGNNPALLDELSAKLKSEPIVAKVGAVLGQSAEAAEAEAKAGPEVLQKPLTSDRIGTPMRSPTLSF